MRNTALLTLALTVAAMAAQAQPASPAAAVSPDPYANETPAQRDARMHWWREARFGMFIHWGVYSVPAGTYDGKRIGGIGEWIMCNGKIPMARYQEYAKEFNPVKFNADEWVRTAKNAGMKYIVITSKHHDGFAMFCSQASKWNICDASPYGRDPLKDLAAACRKEGLKLGFYYSQAQDWNNGGSECSGAWDPAQKHDMDDYIDKVAVPQVKEILSNYGEFPAVLWWDTPCAMNQARAEKLIALLKLKPGIIHNNRLGGGFSGDTETPEQFIPATGYPGRDWETCMTMNDTWGFKSYDQNWKSPETLIRNLVDIASKGGNYLLNIGPTSEGLMPAPSIERLKAVGDWMKVNGEAIYATTASPFRKLPWGRCTKVVNPDGATLYLHVFNWPKDGKLLVPGLKNTVKSAALLASGAKLGAQSTAEGVVIDVPATAPDAISSTLVLKVNGALDVAAQIPVQLPDGTITLPASEAAITGGTAKLEGGEGRDNIGFWTNPRDQVAWDFQVRTPGKFTASALVATSGASAFDLSIGKQKRNIKVPNTGDYTKYETLDLGTWEIGQAGVASLNLKPTRDKWSPVNLRSITLKPAH